MRVFELRQFFLSMPPAAMARFSDFFNVHVDQLAVDMLNVTRKEQQCCGVWIPVRVATWETTEIVASVRLITNEQLHSQNATTAATVRQEVGRVLVVEIAMVPSALFLRSVKLECLARGRYETTPLHRTALWSVGFFQCAARMNYRVSFFAIYSTYLARSESLRTKVQGE